MVRVVILAGGFGTRVKHLLPGLPKPMAPVLGRPFVEWVIRFYAGCGFTDFTLSTGHLSSVIEGHFTAHPLPGMQVRCRQESVPLGTAGGFLNCTDPALPADDLWLIVNGDSLVFADPRALLERVRTGAAAGLLGLSLPDASRYGSLEVAPQGWLRAFREKQPGAGTINAGVYAFTQATVSALPARRPLSFELDVFPWLATEGRVAVEAVAAPFLDIGTPETLAEAEAFITAHQGRFPLLPDLARPR
jgi:D-glycero-alpha-D-manno-heptose 1-phosphate guanylyltransferase